MPHKPDYESPWGVPQSEEDMAKIHRRWIEDLADKNGRTTPPPDIAGEDWSLAQCGGCQYFIPLEGSIGMDWGACSNSRSQHDREVTFEHFGCIEHSEGENVVGSEDVELDSPNFVPQETQELRERAFKRINRKSEER